MDEKVSVYSPTVFNNNSINHEEKTISKKEEVMDNEIAFISIFAKLESTFIKGLLHIPERSHRPAAIHL